MRVLAFDPGYDRLGIAILERGDARQEYLIYSDCFRTNSSDPYPTRLAHIGSEVSRLLEMYRPHCIAAETLYLSNNQKTAMRVAGARGVLLYVSATYDTPAYEFTPLEIKMAITGYGKSDKQQVMTMVKHLVSIEKTIRYDDEFDAIAVGLTTLATVS
jgi:crossover junction endodeoxyribonuclease RuvC